MLLPIFRVVGRLLVRVLAVAQRRYLFVANGPPLREGFVSRAFEPARDGGVVLGRPAERREGEAAAGLLAYLALVLYLRDDLVVELGRGDHRDALEVFGRGAEHGGSADVYLLYGLLLRGVARDGLLERVEVYADEVYGAYVVVNELHYVVGVLEVGEDAAVDLGVKGLYPAVEHLGGAGYLGHLDHRDTRLFEHFSGAAGRDDLEPHPRELARERGDPPLVRYRHQRPTLHIATFPQKKSATARTSSLCSTGCSRPSRLSFVSPGSTCTTSCATMGPASTSSTM